MRTKDLAPLCPLAGVQYIYTSGQDATFPRSLKTSNWSDCALYFTSSFSERLLGALYPNDSDVKAYL
jgi:hypothetical protein